MFVVARRSSGCQTTKTEMASTRLGLVRCEHCGRQFNPHSAARHIPWCAKQQAENRKHRLSQEKKLALERYKWRISYRPSNHFPTASAPSRNSSAGGGHQPFPVSHRAKKSPAASINSSATLSSPSASSTNSIGGTSSLNGYTTGTRRPSVSQHHHQQLPRSQPPATLKRSISSLTLTKQKGTLDQRQQQPQQIDQSQDTSRAKSTNDIAGKSRPMTDMSQVVESLARRMEEIYAQNQLLLARMSRSTAARSTKSLNESGGADDDGEDNESELGSMMLACHHCRSTCLASANYCHKCGCKLHTLSTDASESPG